ncbi:MAG: nucleoside deaminase [Phycisphaera sp.]|nr:nucleoside deaminase [Phycisphaera sp.]
MRLALDACVRGVEAGNSPFGACIVRGGDVLACEHNRVWQAPDATAHAEVNAIRAACAALGDVHLEGATIYSTTEPCPMCFTAIHWARITRIVYAADIADAERFGFNELPVSNATLKQLGGLSVEIVKDFMKPDAVALFERWAQRAGHRPY